MALADVIRTGVAVARSVLSGGNLLTSVSHEPFVSHTSYGESTFGAAVTRYALVSSTNELVKDATRGEIVARLSVLFLEDVAVDVRDRISLGDGTTTPILRVDHGVFDVALGNFYTRVLME